MSASTARRSPAASGLCSRATALPRDRTSAGSGKAVMPAVFDGERAAYQRGQKRPDVDAEIEDRVGAVAPIVPGSIERADLGRNVRLERADADDQHQQREEKQRFERHHE